MLSKINKRAIEPPRLFPQLHIWAASGPQWVPTSKSADPNRGLVYVIWLGLFGQWNGVGGGPQSRFWAFDKSTRLWHVRQEFVFPSFCISFKHSRSAVSFHTSKLYTTLFCRNAWDLQSWISRALSPFIHPHVVLSERESGNYLGEEFHTCWSLC
jgi:hypothetical protein